MKRNIFILLLASFVVTASAQVAKLKPLKEKEMAGALVPVQKKDKWGYAFADDPKQKLVIKNVFEEARPFVDSVAIVKDEGKYGLLHRNGTMRLFPEYDEMQDFENGVSFARKRDVHINIKTDGTEMSRWTENEDGSIIFEKSAMIPFKMIMVKNGVFNMGTKVEREELDYDAPIHEVRITKDYRIGETEVIQQLWNFVMHANPSVNKGDDKPVENITFEDCEAFVTKLSEMFPPFKFRLPTEAEWEFAATGRGNYTAPYAGSYDNTTVAWTAETSDRASHSVKNKQSNALGIYDMCGNVAEWCSDWYNSNYYKVCPLNDPEGASIAKGRVVRGGSWQQTKSFSRSSYRSSHAPAYKSGGLGFRLAL